jgi:hypothetical protein
MVMAEVNHETRETHEKERHDHGALLVILSCVQDETNTGLL